MTRKDFDVHEGAAILTKNQRYVLEDYVSYAIIRMVFYKVYSKRIPFSLVRCPQKDAERVGVRLGCLTVEESYIIVDNCNVDSVLDLWEKYGRICIEDKEWEFRSEEERENVFYAVRQNIFDFFLKNSDVMEDIMNTFISTWSESNDWYKVDGIRGVINNNRSLLQQATNVIESILARFIAQANGNTNVAMKLRDAMDKAKRNSNMKLDDNEYIVILTEPFHMKHIESTVINAFPTGRVGMMDTIRIFIQENRKSNGVEYYAKGISYGSLDESVYCRPFNLNYNALAYSYEPAIKIISEDGNSIGCADLETLLAYCHTVYDTWKSDCIEYAYDDLLTKIDKTKPTAFEPVTVQEPVETKKKREPLMTALKRRMLEICSVK